MTASVSQADSAVQAVQNRSKAVSYYDETTVASRQTFGPDEKTSKKFGIKQQASPRYVHPHERSLPLIIVMSAEIKPVIPTHPKSRLLLHSLIQCKLHRPTDSLKTCRSTECVQQFMAACSGAVLPMHPNDVAVSAVPRCTFVHKRTIAGPLQACPIASKRAQIKPRYHISRLAVPCMRHSHLAHRRAADACRT